MTKTMDGTAQGTTLWQPSWLDSAAEVCGESVFVCVHLWFSFAWKRLSPPIGKQAP
jgi:hypothetical protein